MGPLNSHLNPEGLWCVWLLKSLPFFGNDGILASSDCSPRLFIALDDDPRVPPLFPSSGTSIAFG
jgi:hypothetical protein